MGRPVLLDVESRSLLRNVRFVRLALAQFSATLAIYGLNLAGVALVEERTHSSAQTGLVIISSILPAFMGSLVAGAVVDRWGRVRTLAAGHLLRAVLALVFFAAGAALHGGASLASVYAVNGLSAALTQFAVSAELALLPVLVTTASLLRANAVLQLSMLVAEGLGVVAVAPLAVKLAGAPAMGIVSAGACLLALALVSALPRDRPGSVAADNERSRWSTLSADLRAGWEVISRDRLLGLVTLQATLAGALLLVLLSLVPGMATRYLGLSPEDTPFLMLPGGLGFGLGAALLSRRPGKLGRTAWIALGLICLGLGVGLLSLLLGGDRVRGTLVWSVPLIILAIGVSLALVIIPARAVLQERPPAQVRGRVISAQLALANAVAVVPLLLGGVLADTLGIRPVMAVLGLLALGSGGFGLRRALS